MKNQEIRVRIAPSPTGPLHLGTARTALFNYLFAKNRGGKFILRIEDTDLLRSDERYTKEIIENLRWLGIEWDEGPDIGGPYGPYRQSERKEMYKKYLTQLLRENKAYYCFCTEEELEKEREEMIKKGVPPVYSGHCANLNERQIKAFYDEGRKPIIRFRMPAKTIVFDDLIRGVLEFDTKLIGDIAIAKDIETPLYNFAVVIDDFTMKISHVIRGEDHISNTPKQLALIEALNFPKPQYAHLPLILGPDKTKLSKRHGATSIREYREEGYLPEALLNFIALLGWNPKTSQEIFTKEELIKNFSLKGVSKSGAIFNIEKLNWFNGFYIRKKDLSNLTNLCIPYLKNAGLIEEIKEKRWIIKETKRKLSFDDLKKIVQLEQERLVKLTDITHLTDFFFKEKLDYKPEILIWKKMKKEEVKEHLQILESYLKKIDSKNFKAANLEKKIKNLIDKKKLGVGETLWPFRVALTGREASPPPFPIAEILGKNKVLKRLKNAIMILEK
jgi:nondiscriminating glutamyl-tRNA synthetase